MKIKILSLIAIAGVLTASQAQPTLGTISSSTNRIPTGNSTFAERLNNIINNTSFTRLAGIDTRAGGLIIRRFTNIGYVTGSSRIDIACVAITYTRTNQPAQTNQMQYGIKVELTEGSKPSDRRIAYVDLDEINYLLNGVNEMSRTGIAAAPFKDVELAYATSGGLRVAMIGAEAAKFEVSVLVGRDHLAVTTLTAKQFAKFRRLLENAKTTLDSARKEH